MKPRLLLFVFVLVAAVAALSMFVYAKSGRGFVAAFERSALAAKDSPNRTVTVAPLTDFEWDSLFIFAPYTPVDKIHAQLGYKWTEAEKTHIDSSDTFYLLVFVKNGKVTRHLRFPRTIGSFQSLETGNVFSPGNDAFEVKSVGAGETTRLSFSPKHKGQPSPK